MCGELESVPSDPADAFSHQFGIIARCGPMGYLLGLLVAEAYVGMGSYLAFKLLPYELKSIAEISLVACSLASFLLNDGCALQTYLGLC